MYRTQKILFLFSVVFLLASTTQAQQVDIDIPAQHIFDHSEFNTVKTVMYTGNSSGWRVFFWWLVPPAIRAESTVFAHTSLPSEFLPTDVLFYRLYRIGGSVPPFRSGDAWPGFKNFNTSDQEWYSPASSTGGYNRGNIDFSFKIPSQQFANQKFRAGRYTMRVTHNYDPVWWSSVDFSPVTFNINLNVPEAIQWMGSPNSVYFEINSLQLFRNTQPEITNDLGTFSVGNTVNFDLFAKAANNIQFTATNGTIERRPINILKLMGGGAPLSSQTLTTSWSKMNPSQSFEVNNNNRHNFNLSLGVSSQNLRTHFFKAGLYKFQLNLENRSSSSLRSGQNIEVTVHVPALSELTLQPAGNEVNFEFNTIEKYQQGQSKTVNNQLKLSNNNNFELYVKSDAPYFRKNGIQTTVQASILQVGLPEGNSVALSTNPKKIITNGPPALDRDINIKYTISPAAAQSLVSKPKGTYTLNVVYGFTVL